MIAATNGMQINVQDGGNGTMALHIGRQDPYTNMVLTARLTMDGASDLIHAIEVWREWAIGKEVLRRVSAGEDDADRLILEIHEEMGVSDWDVAHAIYALEDSGHVETWYDINDGCRQKIKLWRGQDEC